MVVALVGLVVVLTAHCDVRRIRCMVGAGSVARMVVCLLALDLRAASVSGLRQEVRGGAPLDNAIGDFVGVTLVGVASIADATRELDARALLDDVCGLVGRKVEIRLTGKGDVVAGRVALGAHLARRLLGRPADVRADARHVVVGSEHLLDHIVMWQWTARSRDPVRGSRVDVDVPATPSSLSLHRRGNGRGLRRLDEHVLAGHACAPGVVVGVFRLVCRRSLDGGVGAAPYQAQIGKRIPSQSPPLNRGSGRLRVRLLDQRASPNGSMRGLVLDHICRRNALPKSSSVPLVHDCCTPQARFPSVRAISRYPQRQ